MDFASVEELFDLLSCQHFHADIVFSEFFYGPDGVAFQLPMVDGAIKHGFQASGLLIHRAWPDELFPTLFRGFFSFDPSINFLEP